MSSPSAPSGYNVKNVQQFTPEQMQLFQMLLSGLTQEGGLGGGFDFLKKLSSGEDSAFQQMEAPYFSALEKGLGQTASRFSRFGARDSSAFENALAGQTSDMAMQLGAQRNQMQMNALNSLLGLSSNLLGQKPFETMLQEKKSGIDWSSIGSSALQALPQLLSLLK